MKTPAKSLGKGSSALCAMLLKSIDDKDPTVRDAAVHAAGALLHVLGESSLGALMDSPKVDKSKVKKISDYAAQLNGDTVAPAAAASTKSALKQRQSVNQAPPPKAGPKKKKAPKEPKPSAAPAQHNASGTKTGVHCSIPPVSLPALSVSVSMVAWTRGPVFSVRISDS